MQNNLLIVDDESELLDIIKEYFADKFDSIISVKSGQEAIDIIQHEEFKVILMDFNMPRLNGVQTIEILKKNGCKSSFVLMSGWNEEVIENQLKELPEVKTIHKPFYLKELAELLKDC